MITGVDVINELEQQVTLQMINYNKQDSYPSINTEKKATRSPSLAPPPKHLLFDSLNASQSARIDPR